MSRYRLLTLASLIFLATISPAASQIVLPEGPGKETVETVCAVCHDLTRITNSGHDRQGWQNVLRMMKLGGAPLPDDKFDIVTDYLAKNFPQKEQSEAVLIPGPVAVVIREWVVPTLHSRPRDPIVTPDGALWYTGQMSNVLGRLDPSTGTIKEYQLPPMSAPHGLVADTKGDIWYTANFGSYVGRFEPKTGKVTEFPMPDLAAKDPHTPIFDHDGILWFTVQAGNRVGRLDPKTGEVRLAMSPTPASRPYGIDVDSTGVPFFTEFGANKIGRIDPATMAIREYVLPNEDARPRRIAITGDDIIWYTDYSRGMLGRLDPKTGAVTEFPSPGGSHSGPYGIAALNGVLWYSESQVEPNTLVRFDPKTQAFQTWAIPSGGGVLRHITATYWGGLAIACSGVDRVGLVEIK
jgi:virginiamycin B lyase